MSASLALLWAVVYGVVFDWNPLMMLAGALLGYAMGTST